MLPRDFVQTSDVLSTNSRLEKTFITCACRCCTWGTSIHAQTNIHTLSLGDIANPYNVIYSTTGAQTWYRMQFYAI